MNRAASLKQALSPPEPWDVIVIGGGATGLGCAVDAASRGYRTLLLEQSDFAKATSSRATKLAHGGVRYLQQGNISLVLEALRERGRMLRNAPHLVRRQSFIIPAYARWEIPFYGIGLKVYDALARGASFGPSRMLSSQTVRSLLPTAVQSLHNHTLAGGVEYFDGQFDDARLCLALAQTLHDQGGIALNYTRVTRLLKHNDLVSGVVARDEAPTTDSPDPAPEFEISARVVINATGIFSDSVRHLDEPQAPPIVTVSQGSHLVLPKSFLPGQNALMVPKTADGRVLFAIPWHGAVVVGTTDDEVPTPQLEPRPMHQETDFLRQHIELYFGRKPEDREILSAWSGQRPLVKKQGANSTAALSREHTVTVSPAHLVSVAGGKWTTYRQMGEDTVSIAAKLVGLPERPSATAELRLHGWSEADANNPSADHELSIYGSDQPAIDALISTHPDRPELTQPIHPRLAATFAHVVWAARQEMALTLDDVLARRTRSLFLDARATIEAAPAVAAQLARELHRDERWQLQQLTTFRALAANYVFQS